jgi:hypothetical protein
VTSAHYLHALKEEFLPFLQGMDVISGETFFQQDRAQPHTAMHFDDRVLSDHFCEWFKCGWSWLPYSPDHNALKNTVYKKNP